MGCKTKDIAPKHVVIQKKQEEAGALHPVHEAIRLMAQARKGGAINLRGISFQILYATYALLTYLEATGTRAIRLEGVEDIDLYFEEANEFVQLKTAQNPIDAGAFWNLNVVQNFWPVYRIDSSSRFRLVHNSILAKGKLGALASGQPDDEALAFWKEKFNGGGIVASAEEIKDFLQKITFERTTEELLIEGIHKKLFEKFGINAGTEQTYLRALFYQIFEGSRQKQTMTWQDLSVLVQSVTDAFSRAPVNPALQKGWITSVSYQNLELDSDGGYYDGKAARPVDIARGLPVHRAHWEDEVIKSFQLYDVTVIKSSSGQGKSTLAWQVGQAWEGKGYAVYQLHYCPTYEEAKAVVDFVETRLKIGQIPLVIIDGINQKLSGWAELAHLLRGKPSRLLLTTREEDWKHYGGDTAGFSCNTLNISLAIKEAAAIFKELQKHNKVHPSIQNWEPAWEKIKERGLLIEYIYLLTQGQMIEERLSHQVQKMGAGPASAAKLELLRMISLADILNIRLRTAKLTAYIQEHIQFGLDRNEVYRQLEKEYYLRFDQTYIEGLHPVRSQHLVQLLHTHLPVDESLLALLNIIEEDAIYDFFIAAPLLFDSLDSCHFYANAAAIMVGKSIPAMVYAIDGLMHLEPYQYWKKNRPVFDEVFKRGGLDLFVYDASPFTHVTSLKNLLEVLTGDQRKNIEYLLTLLNKLSPYSLRTSTLHRFTGQLKEELGKKPATQNAEGITFLFKWFERLGIKFPNLITINEDRLLQALVTKDIGESSDLFRFYSILHYDSYKAFLAKHRSQIIGWIKRKTDTISIEEQGEEIHIRYLLDSGAIKVNELSVYRINIVHAFFPSYAFYCTTPVILPFPNEVIYKGVVQDGTKRMAPQHLGDDFDVHLNQIWSKTILDQYGASSSYEWQKEHIAIRKLCVELVKKCTRLFEAHLEQNVNRGNSLAKEVVALADRFFYAETTLQRYPASGKRYFDQKPFAEEQKAIRSWLTQLRNFLNQLGWLFNPQSTQNQNLPLINLRSCVYHLPAMQQAYDAVISEVHPYFPATELIFEEQRWFSRLLDTIRFYVDQYNNGFRQTVVVAARSIEQWALGKKESKLVQLHTIISEFGAKSPFFFYLPAKIMEEEYTNGVIIGVSGCEVRNEQDLWDLCLGLRALAETNIDFFTFLIVDDNREVTGGFRVRKELFQKFKSILAGQSFEQDESAAMLPVIPDMSMLESLEGLRLKRVEYDDKVNEVFFRMMFNCWKLSQYRAHLHAGSEVERAWLSQLEEEYRELIRQDVEKASNSMELNVFPSKKSIDSFLQGEITYSTEQIVEALLNKIN